VDILPEPIELTLGLSVSFCLVDALLDRCFCLASIGSGFFGLAVAF
jgi:hypothetical protein